MPRGSIWLVRTAFAHLALGFLLGATLLAGKSLGTGPGAPWLAVHREMLLFGWLVQLALGVAWWIFPKFAGDQPYGDPRFPYAAWGALNGGILATGLGLLWSLPWLAAAGRLGVAGAVLLLVIGLRPRVKPFGRA